MNLIGRYIFRQALASTIIVMGVLLLIFMSNEFAETLGDAASDILPREAVFRVFALQFVQYLALLAPIGLLLGVLLALARFNRDSEMAAMAACGIGPGRLIRPIGLLSLLMAGAVGWLALVEAPAANRAIEEILFEAQEELELNAFEPDSFTTISSGDAVLYVRESEADRLRGVFVHSDDGDESETVVAEEGRRTFSVSGREIQLSLSNGTLYRGHPGEANFSVVEFGSSEFPISLDPNVFEGAIAGMPTSSLITAADPALRAEFQWRVAAPLSIVILSLLAVPLGRSSPREGRYARVGVGLLIYIIYANTLSIARVWVERDLVPVWLGTWWVHAIAFLLAILLLLGQSGVLLGRPKTLGVRHEPTG